jgi:hypothetical protein
LYFCSNTILKGICTGDLGKYNQKIIYATFKVKFNYVECEVLAAVVMNLFVFWDMKPCSSLKFNRHIGGTCCFLLQDRRLSQARKQVEAGSKESRLETFSHCATETILPLFCFGQ